MIKLVASGSLTASRTWPSFRVWLKAKSSRMFDSEQMESGPTFIKLFIVSRHCCTRS